MAQNDTLRPKQGAFVAALLVHPTIEAAAEAAGISRRTAHRYLELEPVKAALVRSLDDAMGQATRRAVAAMTEAIQTLEAIHTDGAQPTGARVSAARAILDAGPRLREALDLAERVSALEQQMARDKWR